MGLLAMALFAALVTVEDRPADDSPGVARTVFLGDSITRGVSPTTRQPSDSESWVTYAVADPRSPWELEANAGVFGDTLIGMRQRFEADVLDRRPEGVVILGGTNDVFRGVPLQESLEALRLMVEAAQRSGVEVWIVGPPPIHSAYGVSSGEMVAAQRELAEGLGVPFVDPTPALADEAGEWVAGLSFDGVHLSEAGARRLADAVVDDLSARGRV